MEDLEKLKLGAPCARGRGLMPRIPASAHRDTDEFITVHLRDRVAGDVRELRVRKDSSVDAIRTLYARERGLDGDSVRLQASPAGGDGDAPGGRRPGAAGRWVVGARLHSALTPAMLLNGGAEADAFTVVARAPRDTWPLSAVAFRVLSPRAAPVAELLALCDAEAADAEAADAARPPPRPPRVFVGADGVLLEAHDTRAVGAVLSPDVGAGRALPPPTRNGAALDGDGARVLYLAFEAEDARAPAGARAAAATAADAAATARAPPRQDEDDDDDDIPPLEEVVDDDAPAAPAAPTPPLKPSCRDRADAPERDATCALEPAPSPPPPPKPPKLESADALNDELLVAVASAAAAEARINAEAATPRSRASISSPRAALTVTRAGVAFLLSGVRRADALDSKRP